MLRNVHVRNVCALFATGHLWRVHIYCLLKNISKVQSSLDVEPSHPAFNTLYAVFQTKTTLTWLDTEKLTLSQRNFLLITIKLSAVDIQECFIPISSLGGKNLICAFGP